MHTQSTITVTDLRCEYLRNPLGIDEVRPGLSWKMESAERGAKQTAYQILVASDPARLKKDIGDLWDSGKVHSSEHSHIVYSGKALTSKQQCYWKVRVWDGADTPSTYSSVHEWSMGLLEHADWQGQWIGIPVDRGSTDQKPLLPLPKFRKQIVLETVPQKAFAYIATMGLSELYVNGEKVSADVFSPAVTQFNKRCLYVTYDISKYLVKGTNCLGLWLGYGWFRPNVDFGIGVFRDSPIVKADFDFSYNNGAHKVVATDASWKTHPSHIRLQLRWKIGVFGREYHDAREEEADWSHHAFNDDHWKNVDVIELPYSTQLSAQMVEPTQITDTLTPVNIVTDPENDLYFRNAPIAIKPACADRAVYEVDMGKNVTGIFEIQVQGEPGDRLQLYYYDKEKHADIYNQYDEYIIGSKEPEVFRNHFDYRACRYVRINGLRYKPKLQQIKAHLIHTHYKRVGTFACSNELFNWIYDACIWTYRCLTQMGYIVDCPHRERRGFGGDAHATMEPGLLTFETGAFYNRWLNCWYDSQKDTGELPEGTVQQNPLAKVNGPSWGGIMVALPWQMYLHYADKRILAKSYPYIQKWIDYLESKTDEKGILQRYGESRWDFIGDWLTPKQCQMSNWPHHEWPDPAEEEYFNNCYYLYNLQIAGHIADVLNNHDDAVAYRDRVNKLQQVIHDVYYDVDSHSYPGADQTSTLLPLLLGIAPDELAPMLKDKLYQQIVEIDNGHINAGMHGAYFLLTYLLHHDRNDLVYEMVNKTSFPGWGYFREIGATTIPEQWTGKGSQIHSCYLAVVSWFVEGVAGIRLDPGKPGYQHIVIKPAMVGDLTWARASYDSVNGFIECHWKRDTHSQTVMVTIPVNTTATVYIPCDEGCVVYENDTNAEESEGITLSARGKDGVIYRVESGAYTFRVRSNNDKRMQ